MFVSGINKNTKKFAPKIPQRRKPGGQTPTPAVFTPAEPRNTSATPTPVPDALTVTQIIPSSRPSIPPAPAPPQPVKPSPIGSLTRIEQAPVALEPNEIPTPLSKQSTPTPREDAEQPTIPVKTAAPPVASTPTVISSIPVSQNVNPTVQPSPPPRFRAPIVEASQIAVPTILQTAPVVLISRKHERSPERAESPVRRRARVSSKSQSSYREQEDDEEEEMVDEEEVDDDDRDEDYQEESREPRGHQERGEGNELELERDGSGQAESTTHNKMGETSPTAKGKGKRNAPVKPRAPRKKRTIADVAEGPSTTTIPNKTRASRKPRKPTVTATEDTNNPDEVEGDTSAPPTTRRKIREATPPNAEETQIVPGIIKMADLCRDIKIGKKSKRFVELEKLDWTEIVRKQRAKKARIEAAKAAGEAVPPPESTEERLERLAHENAASRPAPARHAMQVRVVNGQIVLDEETLQVDRRELVENDEPREIIEESSLTRRINAATWGKREKPERWDPESTDKFYQGLAMFGTDFELVSGLFPDRSRRQIKNKFNAEERKNPAKVTNALKNRIAVDIEEYSRITNTEYGDARELERELEEMRTAHEEDERAAVEAAKELERERKETQNAVAAVAGENVIGVVQPVGGRKRGKGKASQFFSRQQERGEEVVLGTI